MGAEVHGVRACRDILRAEQCSAPELKIWRDVLGRREVPLQIDRVEAPAIYRFGGAGTRGAARAENAAGGNFGLVNEVKRDDIKCIFEIAPHKTRPTIVSEDFAKS